MPETLEQLQAACLCSASPLFFSRKHYSSRRQQVLPPLGQQHKIRRGWLICVACAFLNPPPARRLITADTRRTTTRSPYLTPSAAVHTLYWVNTVLPFILSHPFLCTARRSPASTLAAVAPVDPFTINLSKASRSRACCSARFS